MDGFYRPFRYTSFNTESQIYKHPLVAQVMVDSLSRERELAPPSFSPATFRGIFGGDASDVFVVAAPKLWNSLPEESSLTITLGVISILKQKLFYLGRPSATESQGHGF